MRRRPGPKKGGRKGKFNQRGKRQPKKQEIIEDEFVSSEDDSGDSQNQYQVQDIDLNEKMPIKNLVDIDPQAPDNVTKYNWKTKEYIKDMQNPGINVCVHYEINGDMILKESQQASIQETIKEHREQQLQEARKNLIGGYKELAVSTITDEFGQDQVVEDENLLKRLKQTIRNQFNYSQRECQTINNSIRNKGISTCPPSSKNVKSEINQWKIFDAYQAEFIREAEEEAAENQEDDKKKKVVQLEVKKPKSLYSTSFKRCLKIMERTVVQNEQYEVFNDYRYYFDNGQWNHINKQEAHIRFLCRIYTEKTKRKNVTCICWSPRYKDLFAVGYGNYEFKRQRRGGAVCIYSIKNFKWPEYHFSTEKGVMSLDFHPKSTALLAVGLYDGKVLVYDIRNKHKKPIYSSNVRTEKHTDPVWQVTWNPDMSKNINFYSISSDGRVMNWVLMKNKLEPEEVIRLKLTGKSNEEDISLIGLAGGLCFDFNKFNPNIFIVGTEEGKIHQCSRAYSGQYQKTFNKHDLAVYKVRWNYYHRRIFLSASADWTVKIWDNDIEKNPIMSFAMGIAVVDAVWAPYSSTVFAASTLEKQMVYDLSIQKYTKMTERKSTTHAKATNLAFNPVDPILAIGDSKGAVILVKLSPKLTSDQLPPVDTDDKKKKDNKFEGWDKQRYQEYKLEEKVLKVIARFDDDEPEDN